MYKITMQELDIYEPVYALARTIPTGKVATYGQIADGVTSGAFTARQVGTAMRYAPEGVPWQRVVGAGGTLPIAKLSPELHAKQRRLLESEGVTFTATGRIDMARHQWADSSAASGSLFGDSEASESD